MASLLPKKILMSRVAGKCDGTTPHISSTPSPSRQQQKQKSDPQWLSLELCSFSTEGATSTLSGKTLQSPWDKHFFQGEIRGSESEPSCIRSTLTGCSDPVTGKLCTCACPLATHLFSWENIFLMKHFPSGRGRRQEELLRE